MSIIDLDYLKMLLDLEVVYYLTSFGQNRACCRAKPANNIVGAAIMTAYEYVQYSVRIWQSPPF